MSGQLPAHMPDIPASLVDAAETLGLQVVLKLIDAYGGQEIKFPPNPKPDHEVIRLLGEEDGRAICAFLSGQQIYVPHGRPRQSMRAQVRELRRLGAPPREIVRRLGISQRWVRALSADRSDPRQLSLFDGGTDDTE